MASGAGVGGGKVGAVEGKMVGLVRLLTACLVVGVCHSVV